MEKASGSRLKNYLQGRQSLAVPELTMGNACQHLPDRQAWLKVFITGSVSALPEDRP